MEELKTSYESLGFNNIKTYLQSGNVIFDSIQSDADELSNMLENKIRQMFDLSVVVFLRTPNELQKIIRGNPFLKEIGITPDGLYVTFLSQVPAKPDLIRVKETRSDLDRFSIAGSEVYLYCPNGYGRTKLSNEFFEKKLNVKATTRSWKTINLMYHH